MAQTSQSEHFDGMKVEVVLRPHRANITSLCDCDKERPGLLSVVAPPRTLCRDAAQVDYDEQVKILFLKD